eukprot:6415374-Pyramimonas_sp.AAC.1
MEFDGPAGRRRVRPGPAREGRTLSRNCPRGLMAPSVLGCLDVESLKANNIQKLNWIILAKDPAI